jgi:hypothetical protein
LAPLKNQEIPKLLDYRTSPENKFWEKFPKADLPLIPSTGIRIENLEKRVEKVKGKMSRTQFLRAKRAIFSLKNGAPSYQKKPELPSVKVKHSEAAFLYGNVITDNIVSWIKNGFVAGPFDQPPLKKFRSNSILAVKQNEKVRPVLNVSLPENASFNSNIDVLEMEKVKMSSAKKFGQTLLKAGKNAKMAKFDMKEAYKNIPCKICDFRLQGFEWLGKFFVETRQIFGARTSVANYDIVAKTILDITVIESDISPKYVERQLDDVPIAFPVNNDAAERFVKTYEDVCTDCGIKLADQCPLIDKAFGLTTKGKVLGIWFDSKKSFLENS